MNETMTLVTVVCIALTFLGFALTYREFRRMSERRYARAWRPEPARRPHAGEPR